MGFDYFVFSRVPYNLKQKLWESKQLEFDWVFPIGKDLSKITTHVMYDMYWSPEGFEFDDYF